MQSSDDDRDCENQLVLLLGFDQFEFIKTLRQHRPMILYCTLLAQSQNAKEKQKIEQEMEQDAQLQTILRQLKDTAREDIVQVRRLIIRSVVVTC